MDLLSHLRSWSADELAGLLEHRPDLLPASDRGLDAVARKASTSTSIGRVLVGADVGMLVVAEALVAIHPATVDEIDELLGTEDPVAVIEAVDRLRSRGVVTVDDGVIRPVGALPDLLHRPLGLGPSFTELADHLAPERLEALAADTRATGGQRSPTVRAVARRLRDPAVVSRLLDQAPDGGAEVLSELTSARSPAITLPTGHSYRDPDPGDPLGWLIGRGLVVPVTERGAELPRELVMAAHPDGLAPGAALRPRTLDRVTGLDPERVAGRATDRANQTLEGAEALLRLVGRGEVSFRRTGGVGPREIARLARYTGQSEPEVTRLLELLAAARLIDVTGGTVTTNDLAARWWSLTRPRRHLSLVRAWVGADHFLSRGLPPEGETGGGPVALGASEPVAATAAARSMALEVMAEVEPGQAWADGGLAEAVVWRAPNLWGPGQPPPEQLVAWTAAEAELLGLVAEQAPAPLLRAIQTDDQGEAVELTGAVVADDQTTIVLQGDLTALSLGPLAPHVAGPLDQMTDREPGAEGQPPATRFTEASVRRAFDAGWTAESLLAFLTDHALAGVPQPLDYLVTDVARRYGSVAVMAAGSVIITDDDVGAVEIATNRRASALGLKLVAPTVLVSPLDPVAVAEGLRAAGFLPIVRGETIQASSSAADRPTAEEWDGSDVPADWTGPPLPTGPFPDEVADAVASLLDPDASDAGTDPVTRAPAADPAAVDPAAELVRLWGRPARIRTGATPSVVTGVVVGLGNRISVLTVDGVVEIANDALRSVERLDGT